MLSKPIKYFLKIIKGAKISIKITAMYALMFSLALLILNASILYGIKFYLYSQANKQVDDVKAIILNNLASQKENINLSTNELTFDIPSKENISVKILNENGNILNETNKFNYNIQIKQHYNRINHIEEEGKHLIYQNTIINNNIYGTLYVQILKDMENEYDFLKILFVVMAVADFIGIVASIILGYIVSKRMLKPIDDITKAAEGISSTNLKERIEVINGPDDELKRLGSTFNKMIDRLQAAFDRQVQFVSDASHELKTPIAVIQGYANLLDRWGKDDKEALAKSIYAIKLESANMANLVERLLFIAKGDSGTQKIEKKEFLLDKLISELARESELLAPKHIITNNKNETISILADYKMLKEMLRIFIDNSIKYSPEQSIIDISSEIQYNKAKITISDRGIGIPKGEIGKIFDRFYTVDKSRSKEKSGTGLGLSIAKWIVDMHGGTIEIESEEGKYTRVVVFLSLGK